MSVCVECREPLEQPRFGRRRLYHRTCKRRVEKRRERERQAISPPISPPSEPSFAPIPPPEESIPWWQQEQMGYFAGGTFQEYQAHHGIGPLGGDVRPDFLGDDL